MLCLSLNKAADSATLPECKCAQPLATEVMSATVMLTSCKCCHLRGTNWHVGVANMREHTPNGAAGGCICGRCCLCSEGVFELCEHPGLQSMSCLSCCRGRTVQLRDAADKAAMELRAAAARATNAAAKAQVVAESQILQAEEVCPLNMHPDAACTVLRRCILAQLMGQSAVEMLMMGC